MSAKMAALGFLKIEIFLSKGYDIIIFVTSPTKFYDMTAGILEMWSCDQNLTLREVIITSIL